MQIFGALCAHFEKFNDFVAILTEKLQILPWNCIFAHWMTPIFGSPDQKSPHFFFFFFFLVPTPNDPLFLTKFYTERPLFSFSGRHLYATFIFECPSPREFPTPSALAPVSLEPSLWQRLYNSRIKICCGFLHEENLLRQWIEIRVGWFKSPWF